MFNCEMCEAKLQTYNVDDEVVLGTRVSGKSKEDFVKLAFRNGGAIAFYDKMKQAMNMKGWEVSHEKS
jgi:hypothetical protein